MTPNSWRGTSLALGLSVTLQATLSFFLPAFYSAIGISSGPFIALRESAAPGDFDSTFALSAPKILIIVTLILAYVVATTVVARQVSRSQARALPAALLLVTIALTVFAIWPELSTAVEDKTRTVQHPVDALLLDAHARVPFDTIGLAALVIFAQMATFLAITRADRR
jgi:hypothetical protein